MGARSVGMQVRKMDEMWEMNVHVNPMDEEAEGALRQNMQQLASNRDPYSAFIHHVENARLEAKKQRKLKSKLAGFMHEDSFSGTDEDEEESGVANLAEFAKSSATVDMNPERFSCILPQTADKQKPLKKEYAQRMPYYLNVDETLRQFRNKDNAVDMSVQEKHRAKTKEFFNAYGQASEAKVKIKDSLSTT